MSGLDNLFLTGEAPGHNNQEFVATKKTNQRGRRQIVNEDDVSNPPKKKRKSTGRNWLILETIWPAAERPEALLDPEWIEDQSIGDLMQLHKVYSKKEQKEQGQAIGRATKDSKPPEVDIEAGKDDCNTKLHVARFLRMPISRPKDWYHRVPTKHTHSYRNVPVKHALGLDSAVAPAVVLARHDRKNSLQLKHFNRSNANITSKPMREIKSRDSQGVSTISDYDWMLPNNVRQCQDSILNFAAVNRTLWAYDYTDIALTKVLNRYDWCGAAASESDRVKLIRALFNRVMEDNSFRAADNEAPMEYEEIEKLMKETLIGKTNL